MDVTTTYYGIPTVHSFTGSTNVVNRNSSTAPFGRGWQLAGLDQLVSQTGGMLFVRSDGTTLWFADNGSGGYLHAEGDDTYSTLVKNANLTYTLTDTHGNQTNFSSAGLLTSRVDANGNTTSYTYTSGLLTQITDPFGRNTTFTYTSGRLTSVTRFRGPHGHAGLRWQRPPDQHHAAGSRWRRCADRAGHHVRLRRDQSSARARPRIR